MSISPSFSEASRNKGMLAALGAFLIWGMLPLYWRALDSLPLLELLSLRLICLFVFLTLLLLSQKMFGEIAAILRSPKQVGILVVSAAFLASTWLIEVWAVKKGLVLEVSLGYFITPLCNIMLGRLLFHDSMNRTACCAVVLAFLGVGYQVMMLGSVPLVALGISGAFALYGLVRKLAPVEAVNGLYIESIFFLPVALACFLGLVRTGTSQVVDADLSIWIMCLGLGPVTACPLIWFAYGIRRISLTIMGLVQYLTPSMAFMLSITVFKERVTADGLVTFVFIWMGLILYTWDSVRRARRVPSA